MAVSTLLTVSLAMVSLTAAQDPCDVFTTMACPIVELNVMDSRNNATDTTECQTWCTQTEGCNVFTHFIDMESCYLLTKCEEYVACENCISGPKTPSFESCQATSTTTTTTTGPTSTTTTGPAPTTTTGPASTTTAGPTSTTTTGPAPTTTTGPAPTTTTGPAPTTTTTDPASTTTTDPAPTTTTDPAPTTTTDPAPTTTTGPATTTTTGPAPTTTTVLTTAGPCNMFYEASCDITEDNTVSVKHDLTVGACQDMCLGVPECHMFTWYPSLGNLGICFLLKECNDLEVCPYCISGPEAGYDVDTCFDITTTTQTSTTTTTNTVPSTSTTVPDECGVFTEGTCDITDDNNLDIVHDVTAGQCQDMCGGSLECNWFTWYAVSGLRGTCWFLDHCNSQEPCDQCVSGPAVGPDVDDCL